MDSQTPQKYVNNFRCRQNNYMEAQAHTEQQPIRYQKFRKSIHTDKKIKLNDPQGFRKRLLARQESSSNHVQQKQAMINRKEPWADSSEIQVNLF